MREHLLAIDYRERSIDLRKRCLEIAPKFVNIIESTLMNGLTELILPGAYLNAELKHWESELDSYITGFDIIESYFENEEIPHDNYIQTEGDIYSDYSKGVNSCGLLLINEVRWLISELRRLGYEDIYRRINNSGLKVHANPSVVGTQHGDMIFIEFSRVS